ncbi:lysophospholipid acyltransferase family protein [Streptomyces sp. WMMC500]|uniref:lysophospholipid acyltransferase family protein n=1 Tax=Streptomyces sp. WMMC500 TaxID=3015154 RepID=UPI00248CEE67|nr:lysophospholipid acyltransferase family protein [Streptomyces sp. WMMC500]WBB63959.1 lysophospholipid acyltransferase family protein [Streptomyces sp. WMMC500]
MADAKVIPFDDDRSRGGGKPRRRGGAGRPRRADGGGAAGAEAGLSALPGGQGPAAGEDTERTDAAGAADDAAKAGAGSTARTAPPGAEAADAVAAALQGALKSALPRLLGGGWERRAADALGFLRRRLTGDYEVDEFGYDRELTDQVLVPLFRPVFEKYFRVTVKGVENIPDTGGALVVCNHSGTLPWDGLMAQVAVHDHHPADRHLRLLAADLVFVLPFVNQLARKGGHTLACADDAARLLAAGEVVGVMPEGFKGLGKPFAERYKLQRFGRGGFVSTALRARVPIVPCSIVGAEEIYPMIGNAKTVARLLGLPYFPVTPTFPWLGALGAVPLPTKWTIEFGEPILTDGYPPEAADDPMLMFNLTDQVRETIQHTLYKLLVERRSVFF